MSCDIFLVFHFQGNLVAFVLHVQVLDNQPGDCLFFVFFLISQNISQK